MTNEEGSQSPKLLIQMRNIISSFGSRHFLRHSTFDIRASSLGFSFLQINHATTPTAAPPKWANDETELMPASVPTRR